MSQTSTASDGIATSDTTFDEYKRQRQPLPRALGSSVRKGFPLAALGNLGKLCPELRHEVYGQIFSPDLSCWRDSEVVNVHRLSAQCEHWDLWKCPLPASLALNSQIYNEAVHAFWSQQSFELTVNRIDAHGLFHLREAIEYYIRSSHGHIKNVSVRLENSNTEPTIDNLVDLSQFYSQYADRLTGDIVEHPWQELRGELQMRFLRELVWFGRSIPVWEATNDPKAAAHCLLLFLVDREALLIGASDHLRRLWTPEGRDQMTKEIEARWQHGLETFYAKNSLARQWEENCQLRTCYEKHQGIIASLEQNV